MDDEPLFYTRLSNLGFEISTKPFKPIEPAPDADQESPRQHYVYAHVDNEGKIFYIGKGTKRRAWAGNRHELWVRYVETHLNGEYKVKILNDNLSEDEAEEVEAAWLAQTDPNTLVNWINMSRGYDKEALERLHRLRNANKQLIQDAKRFEKTELEKATEMYIKAIEAIKDYAFIKYEQGIVGQLLEEEREEVGFNGELEALDRLSLCLVKLNRPQEAAEYSAAYFKLYRLDEGLGKVPAIKKRIEKALERLENSK